MVKSFRKFVEDSENHPLMTSLDDILGIDPEDMKKEPQIASFFKISQGTNLGSYKIVRYQRNSEGKITHAVIKPIHADKIYKDKEGSPKRIPKEQMDSGEKLVPIKDLDVLMGQNFSQNQQQML